MKDVENNVEIKQECFCQKRFKDVLAIAIGSFIGVYCALSLFAAIHKPPCHMMHHHFGPYHMMQWQMMHGKVPNMDKFKHGKFKVDFDKNVPEKAAGVATFRINSAGHLEMTNSGGTFEFYRAPKN